jgi:hypothetical protein
MIWATGFLNRTATWNIWEKLCLLKVRHYRRSFRSFGAWRLITFTEPLLGAGSNKDFWAFYAFYMNSEDLTRDLVVPCWAGAAAPSASTWWGLCEHNEHNMKLASAIWKGRRLISLIVRPNTHSSKYKICFTNSSLTFGSKAISLPLSALELFKPLFTLPFKCHWKVSLRIEYFSQLC